MQSSVLNFRSYVFDFNNSVRTLARMSQLSIDKLDPFYLQYKVFASNRRALNRL